MSCTSAVTSCLSFESPDSYVNIYVMGLDFTTIKDQPGSAIYLIHDGTELDKQKFEDIRDYLSTKTRLQIVLMSSDDANASKIVGFYHLKGSHFAILVRDDDQLHRVWSDGENFDPAVIAYTANQVG